MTPMSVKHRATKCAATPLSSSQRRLGSKPSSTKPSSTWCGANPGHRARSILIVALCLPANAPHAATVVGTFNDWTLYSNADDAGKICFLASPPASTEPANLKRDPALLYISSWPKDGVKSEVSIKLGFPAKKSPDPVAAIVGPAPASFKLFPKDDRVYVSDSTQELKLLDAMKKGSKLTVQAISERGTTVTDTYSLNGISAALQAFAGGCP